MPFEYCLGIECIHNKECWQYQIVDIQLSVSSMAKFRSQALTRSLTNYTIALALSSGGVLVDMHCSKESTSQVHVHAGG